MDIKKQIKVLIAMEGKTMTEIACQIYNKNKDNKRAALNNLSQKFRNETVKYKEIKQIADILGYDIKFEKRK